MIGFWIAGGIVFGGIVGTTISLAIIRLVDHLGWLD